MKRMIPLSSYLYADYLSVLPQIFSGVFSEGLVVIHLDEGNINIKTIVLSWIIMVLYQSPVFETLYCLSTGNMKI